MNIDTKQIQESDIDQNLLKDWPSTLTNKALFPIHKSHHVLHIASLHSLDIQTIQNIESALNSPVLIQQYTHPNTDKFITTTHKIQHTLQLKISKSIAKLIEDAIQTPDQETIKFLWRKIQELLINVYSAVHLFLDEDGSNLTFETSLKKNEIYTLNTQTADKLHHYIMALFFDKSWDLDVPQSKQISLKNFENRTFPFELLHLSNLPKIKLSLIKKTTQSQHFKLTELGLNQTIIDELKLISNRPGGITIFSSPFKSGKSTSLHALIEEMDPEKTILCLEDPTHKYIRKVDQVLLNTSFKNNFSEYFTKVLPIKNDIIVTDPFQTDYLQDIIHAAQNGTHVIIALTHISAFEVLNTLINTNNPALTSLINGILNQRIVRVICPHCKQKITKEKITNKMHIKIFESGEKLLRQNWQASHGQGCEICLQSGYSNSKTGLFEYIKFDDSIRKIITNNFDKQLILQANRKHGFSPIIQDALMKIRMGITSIEEVSRFISF